MCGGLESEEGFCDEVLKKSVWDGIRCFFFSLKIRERDQ